MDCSIPTPSSCLSSYLLHMLYTISILWACSIPNPSAWLASYLLHPPGLLLTYSLASSYLLHPPGLFLTYSIFLACSIPTPSSRLALYVLRPPVSRSIPTPLPSLLHTYSTLLCLAPYLVHPPGLLHTYS